MVGFLRSSHVGAAAAAAYPVTTGQKGRDGRMGRNSRMGRAPGWYKNVGIVSRRCNISVSVCTYLSRHPFVFIINKPDIAVLP